ncbi:MAG: exodeoxyribonuclease VII small subunit [Nocardioidaceae bacterium]
MTDPADDTSADDAADTGAGAPKPDIPYEEARDELIEVVRKLEAGGTTLEESLALWERGEHLAGVCEQWLEGAKARLQNAMRDSGRAGEESGPGSAAS